MARLHVVGGLGGLLALISAILLLIVSVGVPVWRDVFFLDVKFDGCEIKLGIWSYCFISPGAGQTCGEGSVGYPTTFHLFRRSREYTVEAVPDNLTAGLVLHPICCGLATVAFLLSLNSRFLIHVLGSIVAGGAAFLTMVTFFYDIGVFLAARSRFRDIGVDSSLHNAVWMVLGAWLGLAAASLTICCTGIEHRRRAKEEAREAEAEEG